MDVDPLVHAVQDELVELVKSIEGFIGYYMIDGGDGTVISITLGEIEEAVEASTAVTQHWVVERAAHLVEGAPDVTAGEVRVRAER
ncbi:MAG: hypothetical protein ABSG43_07315 [Solirubrobacteraceae bacterium]|jgi:hypothetical protein